MSFRRKLLIALVLVALAPIAVFTWFASSTAYHGLRERIVEQLWTYAKLEAGRVADHIDRDRDRLALVCSRTQLRLSLESHLATPDPQLVAGMERIMGDARDAIPNFERIAVADMDGTVVAATDPALRGGNAGDPDCFSVARNGEFAHIFREQTNASGELIIVLHGPLVLEGTQIGVAIVHARADTLVERLGSEGLGESEKTLLARTGPNARSLAPLLPPESGSRIVNADGVDLLAAGSEGVFDDARDSAGNAVLAAVAPVPGSGYCVISILNQREALAPASKVRMMGLLAAGLVIPLILFASAVIARTTVRPVRNLLGTANRIVDGDLDVRAKVHADDEIGELAKGFNAMTEQLVDANRKLGRKVEERTEELEKTKLLLIQAEKLESLGRLAAGVAHEVKNPLYMIQMGIDYFRTKADEDEAIGRMVANMQNAVDRADTIIRGMLDLSRSDELNLADADLNEVVESGLLLVAHELKSKEIELEKECGVGLPQVRLDRSKFQQVLINLVTNAVHAMEDEGGRLKIRSYKARLTGDAHNEGLRLCEGDRVVVLEVVDNGPGFPDGASRRVLEPFFTTKSAGKGTGLGLSVVRTIINLHNGEIEIENVKPHGALVRAYFKAIDGDDS